MPVSVITRLNVCSTLCNYLAKYLLIAGSRFASRNVVGLDGRDKFKISSANMPGSLNGFELSFSGLRIKMSILFTQCDVIRSI